MSTAPDYESLLRQAVDQAREQAPRAADDLLRFSSQAADAVYRVTTGAAVLELVPINRPDGAARTYQLQLRKVGSEAPPSDLGVYQVTGADGYPVFHWYSRRTWEDRPGVGDGQYPNPNELEGHFRWLISKPESRLVVLVTFFQQKVA